MSYSVPKEAKRNKQTLTLKLKEVGLRLNLAVHFRDVYIKIEQANH